MDPRLNDLNLWCEPRSNLICWAEDDDATEGGGADDDDRDEERDDDSDDDDDRDDESDDSGEEDFEAKAKEWAKQQGLLSKEEADERAQKAVEKRLRRERRKKAKSREPEKKTTPEPAEPTFDREDFEDAMEDVEDDLEIELSKKAKRTLRKLAKAAKPDDLQEWVEDTVKSLGLAKKPEPETATKDDRPAQPKGKPKSDHGSPRPVQDYEAIRDPNQLSTDDIRRMELKYGKPKAWKMIRDKAEAWQRDRPIRK